MKKIILAGLAMALLVFNGSSKAQNSKDKKDKKVSVKIITEENGKKTVIDTTFDAKDDAAMESFMKAHNINRPLPPLPPPPPAAPNAPNAPIPPSPPSPADDDEYSFQFNFDDEDFDELRDNIDEQMMEVKEQLEQAKKEIKIALEKSKISKEQIEQLQNEIIKELDKIDINVEDEKENKRIIIHKKTGDVGNDEDMQWNTNAFVTGNGKVVKCIVKDGDKTNCRMMVIKSDEVNSDEVNSDDAKRENKDPEAPSQEKKTLPDNQLNADDFKVYPNPNSGSFDLSFHLDTYGKTEISVLDASGKEVFSESFADFTGDYNKHIDLPSKGKGTYLLNVKQDERWMHKKVVVK